MSGLPFIKQSAIERFTPKQIRFSKLYKSNTKGGKLGDNILIDVKSNLRKSGFSDAEISRIITADKPAAVNRMKEVAGILSKAKIFGFENDPERDVKRFLNAERVKAQNIARIRKEQILEAAEENLAKAGTTSLNRKAIGPNSSKTGEASVMARRRNPSAAYSISDKSEVKKITSFGTRPSSGAIARPGMGGSGSTGGSVFIKPKF